MKALKKILAGIILLMLPFVKVVAQQASHTYQRLPFTQPAECAQYEFHTTSALHGSGSSLPNAAQNGVVMSGSTLDAGSSGGLHGGIRRIGGSGSGTGGNEAEENEDPQETPIGDGMWVLMLLAAGYGAWMMRRIRARRNSGEE